jgi:hypothetical protein
MELRRWENQPDGWKRVRRGWCLGDEAFRSELPEQMGQRLGAEHYGTERRETAEAKDERILQETLKRLKWTKTTSMHFVGPYLRAIQNRHLFA